MTTGELWRSSGDAVPRPASSLPVVLLILVHADVPRLIPPSKPIPAELPISTGNDMLKGTRSVTPEGVGNELRTP